MKPTARSEPKLQLRFLKSWYVNDLGLHDSGEYLQRDWVAYGYRYCVFPPAGLRGANGPHYRRAIGECGRRIWRWRNGTKISSAELCDMRVPRP